MKAEHEQATEDCKGTETKYGGSSEYVGSDYVNYLVRDGRSSTSEKP